MGMVTGVQILDEADYLSLILLGKVKLQLFPLQLRVNSRTDNFLQVWLDNPSRKRKTLNSNMFAQSAGAVEYTDCFSAEG